jgi:topoisomerase IA-like protein
MSRIAFKIQDLYSMDALNEKIEMILPIKNKTLEKVYGLEPYTKECILSMCEKYAELFRPYVCFEWQDMLNRFKDKTILFEGAQGVMLDIDYGTYPYVTSSNPIAGGAGVGASMDPMPVERAIGVLKAYMTRLGDCAFVTYLEDESGEKPQYANISGGLLVATITLEEALELFRLPRTLGEFEDKVVVVSVGRFGPYIRHDGKFVSLPKSDSPYAVTLERAIELIEAKRIADEQRHLKKFVESDDLEIMNGRWGAYIAYDGKNYKLPKSVDIQALSYDECLKIIESQQKKDSDTKSPKRDVTKSRAKKRTKGSSAK